MDCFERLVGLGIRNCNFDHSLGQELHDVVGTAIEFRMALLPAATFDVGDRHTLDAKVGERRAHLVALEWLDDLCAGVIPWLSMNWLQKTKLMMKVDDTLSVFSTHGVAGLTGGLLVGLLANPAMLMYIGTDKEAPGFSVTGLLYGNTPQLLLQAEGAAFIIVYNVIATFIILKVISIFVPLRMDEATLKVGDDAVHGETAYAIGVEGE